MLRYELCVFSFVCRRQRRPPSAPPHPGVCGWTFPSPPTPRCLLFCGGVCECVCVCVGLCGVVCVLLVVVWVCLCVCVCACLCVWSEVYCVMGCMAVLDASWEGHILSCVLRGVCPRSAPSASTV